MHLREPWRAEQFKGDVPRIVYTLEVGANLSEGVAEFQVLRTRIPHLDDKSSLAAIADALVLKQKIAFNKLIFGEKVIWARAPEYVTKEEGKETYWYTKASDSQLRRAGESYAKVGVVFTQDLFTQGVVYVVTGIEVNNGHIGHARHFDVLDLLVEGITIAPPAAAPNASDASKAGKGAR